MYRLPTEEGDRTLASGIIQKASEISKDSLVDKIIDFQLSPKLLVQNVDARPADECNVLLSQIYC